MPDTSLISGLVSKNLGEEGINRNKGTGPLVELMGFCSGLSEYAREYYFESVASDHGAKAENILYVKSWRLKESLVQLPLIIHQAHNPPVLSIPCQP